MRLFLDGAWCKEQKNSTEAQPSKSVQVFDKPTAMTLLSHAKPKSGWFFSDYISLKRLQLAPQLVQRQLCGGCVGC